MIKSIDSKIIPIDKGIVGLCKIPYHGHSKGCPNHGKKAGCPPGLLSLDSIFDFNEDIHVVYTKFKVGEFAERMKIMHPEWKDQTYLDNPKFSNKVRELKNKLIEKNPDWKADYFPAENKTYWKSSREWYNPRRWQGVARKEHSKEIFNFFENDTGVVDGDLEKALKIFFNASSRKSSPLINNGLLDFNGFRVNKCPEAYGVNITGLMAELGVKLDWQWPPEHNLDNITYMVSLIGKIVNNK